MAHPFYNTARWKRLRAAQLAAHPLCAFCVQLGYTELAEVVDHKRPHRGDPALFFDADNLQSLSKRCHDRHKQAQEHNADGLVRGTGLTGAPIDPAHPWHTPTRGRSESLQATEGKPVPTLLSQDAEIGRGGLRHG